MNANVGGGGGGSEKKRPISSREIAFLQFLWWSLSAPSLRPPSTVVTVNRNHSATMNCLPVILKFHYFPAGGRRTYVLYGAGKFPEGKIIGENTRGRKVERNSARSLPLAYLTSDRNGAETSIG